MNPDNKPTEPVEKELEKVLNTLQPPAARVAEARRRLLAEYDRIQQRHRRGWWPVPAAAAAGILVGVLSVQLFQSAPPVEPASRPLANRQPPATDARATRLLRHQQADIDALLQQLETASAETWMDRIAERLQAHDWRTARVLIEHFEQRYPDRAGKPALQND